MNSQFESPQDNDVIAKLERCIGETSMTENRIVVLENGDEIFPAMLDAIRNAEKTICFLTYVYWEGEIAKEFAEALSEKARNGVRCEVLLDAHGSAKTSSHLLDGMEKSGVILARYNPFTFSAPLRYQHRTHRKILVCDGVVGFFGGVGIADEWKGNARNPNERHDFHFRAGGPCVESLAKAFRENWESSWTFRRNGKRPAEDIPFDSGPAPHYDVPKIHSGMESDVRVLPLLSSPREAESEAVDAYFTMLDSATKHIRIISAYLIPDQSILDAFQRASLRGVKIDLIVPGPYRDSWLAQSRSRAAWPALLSYGVNIHLYQPTMCHAKVTIVDDELCTIGSINFDILSFRLNEEANLIVHSKSFASLMTEKFEKDLRSSKPLVREEFEKRSAWLRFKERLSKVFPLPYWKEGCHY